MSQKQLTSQEIASKWYILTGRVIDGDLHPELVLPLLVGSHRIQIDFEAALKWNPQITQAHAQN